MHTAQVASTYQRPISALEWAYLANPRTSAMTIQLFVEGAGTLDRAALAVAAEVAATAQPGTRLSRRGRMWVDSGRVPQVREVDGSLLDRTSLTTPGLARPLRGDGGGPLNEIVLLTGERPALVFRAHHAVMDGRGVLTWARGVFSALRGEPVKPALDAVTDGELLRRLGIPEDVRLLKMKVRPVFRGRGSFRRRGLVIRRRTLAGTYPAVVARLAATVNAILGLPEAAFYVPVDMRRHDPEIHSTGNLTSGFGIGLAAGMTWRQAHSQVIEELGRNTELATVPNVDAVERILRIPQAVLRPVARLADTTLTYLPTTRWSFSISDHGRLDPADFSSGSFTAQAIFAVPGRGYLLPPTLTVVHLPGRPEIVFASDGGPGVGEAADRLLDRVVAAMSEGSWDEVRDEQGDVAGLGAVESPLALIRAHASRDPDQVALLEPDGHSLSYGRLADVISSTVDALRQLGVRPRDRVATVLADGLDAGVFFLATATAAVSAPLNPAYSADELETAFDVLAPALVVVSPRMSATARAAAERRGIPVADLERDDDGFRLTLRSGRVGGHVPAPDAGERLLLQTSGTTGHGKLVPLTWATMLAGARASCRAYTLTTADRRLNIMPLFHVQGLVGSLLTSLASGSSVVCAGAARPEDVLRWLDEHDVTWFSASPTMHQRILDRAPHGWRPTAALRFVRSGSAALPPALRERLEEFYRLPVVESYGMTEAHQIASTPLVVGDTKMVPTGSEIGFLTGGEIVRAAGVRGEIVVRGGNVISRYVHPDEANADSFADGWFRTGDEGELTPDGRLLITGRIKDLIIRGGEKVAPLEVESALARHPAVHQVAVCGVPDPEVNEQVAAVVVLHEGMTATDAELREFARTLLAPYKVPTLIEYRTQLPATKAGKVSRSELAGELSALIGRVAPERRPVAVQDEPRTPTEKELAAIWADTLGLPAVGVHDDFFALGGQSLEGVALLASVQQWSGLVIEPLLLFEEANTIARMANVIDQRRIR